ncbi:AMP-binding protein [Actinomycetospora soli]|uniref:AMP-binding protein n=1 Tax=Actinomycetospora soli TaxID=2893887 RepID=UPI001E523F4E|nr:AMP-binding protein [Actinomycetospora soli]MCD2185818.1 AMP-binding protein [Actinomycetospora soli]
MISLARELARHDGRIALVSDDESVTYRELAARADTVARALGPRRRLVLAVMSIDVASVVGYLGALRGGHAVLLAPPDPARVAALRAAWDPDAVVVAGTVTETRPGSAHELHPGLALLLATSGSTGSPRLVRLGAAGVDANVAAVADRFDVRPDDRAVAMLPLHYCYGLSVLHTTLDRGAALLLRPDAVTEPSFWAGVHAGRATSLHGVPHTFGLLDGAPALSSLTDLRYVTQAGGRLAPEDVTRWTELGRRRGWRFHVMYGQTEATARMTISDPDLAAVRPDSVGRPLAGGRFTVAGNGELVYHGPNVMFGYADSPADLARGREVEALRTGDLGRVHDDGSVEVTGRLRRVVKPGGVRVDLDALERLLHDGGVRAACAGDDGTLVVAVVGDATTVDAARTLLTGLPARPLVVPVAELPRLTNGKVDHVAVRALGRAGGVRGRPRTVREVFARALPGTPLRDDASFVDLGGTSLTYVRAAADLERVLGRLPEGWDRIPLGELGVATPAVPPRGRAGRREIETVVALRAAAIVAVVGTHAEVWEVLGGAHLLLVLAGFTVARFALAAPDPTRRLLRGAAALAVPSAAWIALRSVTEPDAAPVDALLLGSVVTPLIPAYWFIAALLQIVVLLALLHAVPAVRRLDRRYPFGLPVAVLAGALVGRFWPVDTALEGIFDTHRVAWLVVLGWVVFRATTPARRGAVGLAALVLAGTFFPVEPWRAALVAVGVLILLFVRRVALPAAIASVASTLAAASLAIYLTHFAVLGLADRGVPGPVLVVLALAVGVAAWWVGAAGVAAVSRRRGRARPATAPVPAANAPAR